MKLLSLIVLALFSHLAYSQDFGSFIDERDSIEYKTIIIGEQIWMAENLAYLPDTVIRYDYKLDMPEYYVYGWSWLAMGGVLSKTEAGLASELKENKYYKELCAYQNLFKKNYPLMYGEK